MLFTKAIVAAGGFAALSSAHMVINTPKPFSSPQVHNGPLKDDGSDFPCQAGASGGYSSQGVTNIMALGSSQPLAFTGTAVHGGGSCQVSITYDTAPDKNSVWKVIHSIEGGCPAKNTPGNLGNDASAADPFAYSFPIPDDIPTGNATIAWTWLNKIGNREFYMNCAPVTLTGTSGDKGNWEALPDMLTANIGNGCTTTEGKDYKYPNPGKSVESFASSELVFPVGNCGASGNSGSGSGSPSPSAPAVAAPSPSPSAFPSAPAGAPVPTLPGGVFITVPTAGNPASTVAPKPVASSPVATPEAPASSPTAPAAQPAPTVSTGGGSTGGGSSAGGSTGGSSSGSGSAGSASGAQAAGSACSVEGQWNCVGGTSYQQCGSGTWTPIMAVAAGTKCTPGLSSAITIVAGGKTRRIAVRFRA
ncbi:hypothetical protein B0T22DRAFT_199017 [Podospora appendiculata]|uniref:Glycoside Hydrolase Family 61 n=1 Tax=Podospora appendiculata TaxID=314037 RepID=A0AAE0X4Q1_9PEZI|nr:hypothetical protein B0T22DRAFT_199017 [Podospora appendiculata]